MKRYAYFLLLLCAMPVGPGKAWSSETSIANYILPEGGVYTDTGFFAVESADDGGVRLRFADEVTILGESMHGSLVWFRCAMDGSSFFLPETHLTAVSRRVVYASDGNLPLGRELPDPSRPLPIRYEPNDLEVVPPRYGAGGYEDRALLLRREAKEKFVALIEDAEKEGVVVRILSAYRSARYQAGLYGNAVAKRGVFQNSVAKPGYSEHQLGTTCDLTTDEIRNGLSTEFESTGAFRWIEKNGHRYGIFLSYPKYGERVTGYVYEPWHYRYYGNARWSAAGGEGRVFLSR
jgi:hypothetical protein